jgi:hypothetical protein
MLAPTVISVLGVLRRSAGSFSGFFPTNAFLAARYRVKAFIQRWRYRL